MRIKLRHRADRLWTNFVSRECIALVLVFAVFAFVLIFAKQTASDGWKSIADVKVDAHPKLASPLQVLDAPGGTIFQFASPRNDSIPSFGELARKPDIAGGAYFADKIPTFIKMKGSESGFFICLIQKTASSVIKHALNETYGFGRGTDVHKMPNPNSRLTSVELANLLGKSVKHVPRFVVTRNPYTRLLSAYNDKYHKEDPHAKQVGHRPFPGTKQNFTFAMLVKSMHELWRAKGDAYLATIDLHFRPVHLSHCGFSRGLTYDFRLPLEKLQTWADDFAMYTNLSAQSLESLKRSHSETFDPHDFHSDLMLNKAYTGEMKKMTLDMFRKDFKLLGYSEEFPKPSRLSSESNSKKCLLPGEKCVDFDHSRGRDGHDPYPSAKIIIANGCSISTAVSQMLKNILDLQNFTHLGPCKLANELLKPHKNRCGGSRNNMTGPILNNIATLDLFGQRLVAKFSPGRLGSVDPEIHKYAAFDAVSLHRRNVFDVGICRVKDCFNRRLGRVLFENGTTSTLCFERRKHPNLNFKIEVDVAEMKKFIKEETKMSGNGHLFDGRHTDNYATEDLTVFQTSGEDADLRTSFDAWVRLLSSLGVKPNHGVIYDYLREKRRVDPRGQQKPHRFLVINADEVRKSLFDDPEMVQFKWMWRD